MYSREVKLDCTETTCHRCIGVRRDPTWLGTSLPGHKCRIYLQFLSPLNRDEDMRCQECLDYEAQLQREAKESVRLNLKSQKTTVESMLREIPLENVIDRAGLQSRLKEITEELNEDTTGD